MYKYSLMLFISIGLMACDNAKKENHNNKQESESATLDLTLPAGPTVDTDLSRQDVLPNFFEEKKKKKNTKISGKILNDSSNPDYVESIEGAEVSIEIKME